MGKKGYGSCFGEDYQQYTKHIIKYVDNHFNNDKNINTKCFRWFTYTMHS